ncbi:thyroglobulin [Spea bombifrons]|uniref:thyroglobulin n=1 Tax=Spea bombifrons TaxID=233779 RepID=UPI002349F166|nr:thyroglobulin [Spea bombifrons]
MGIVVRPETMLSVYGVLFIMGTASAVTSEYQLDSQTLLPCELAREKASRNGADYIPQCSDDGLFRNIQCTRNGLSCWCVDVDGDEVPGSRRTGSPPLCLSFCQLKKQQILVSGYINRTSTSYIPQCKDSGAFESVQCNHNLGQCWCVDTEGMEIYGTRQIGKPKQCPRNCEIRDRRILHGVGEKVPPHCSDNGEFSPVQCKLVNTTDKMILDIVTSFSRFPDAFKSFTSLRESFPEISGYCYCADRLGRELANTGLELLLDEVYDTVFAGQSPSRSFTGTTIYRILQRRFLGVQLITSGKFRCPTTCEVQRFTAAQMGGVYIPSCTENGDFEAVQCQTGGQCWCVDSKGREIYGSRLQGKLPNCNNYQDCSNRRRQALSSLFYGPSGPFGQRNLFETQEEEFGPRLGSKHCSSYVLETFVNSGLLNPIDEKFGDKKTKMDNFISDMVTGLFPSRDLIQLALKFTKNPKRFQQNLFGGKYLKNMGSFNFTGAVGVRSKFNFSGFFQQIGLTGMYSGGNFKELAKLFSSEEDSYLTKDSSNFSKQSFNLNQPIQASFGQIVNLQENQNLVALFVSILELEEFSKFLREVVSVPPKISEDVSETVKIVLQSKACPKRDTNVFVPTCTQDGGYDEIQCSVSECWCVDDSGEEIEGSRTRGKKARCPTKCEKERDMQKLIKKSRPAGSELFIPSCDRNGNFWTVQCIGKKCFCVDFDGQIIPGTQKLSGENIQCPSNCQLTASKEFLRSSGELLSGSRTVSQLSEVFIPQCSEDGDWKPVQCSGPTEQAFELYQAWTTLNRNISFSETPRVILTYKKTSSQSFSDFVLALYTNGHQNVFPFFSKYSSFSAIPEDVLGGNITVQTDNVLLNPYLFWRILSGDLTYYPGAYSDFSVPLSHFDLRTCWCVDPNGQKIQGSEVMPNKIPKCPGRCEIAKLKSLQFIEEAEDFIEASNTSRFPFGQSFLLANGIRLSEMDLLHADGSFKSGVTFSESFMNRDNYHLQLAAQSTLHFYWRRRFASFGETTQSAYVPYVPQCDELGEWEPVQFYESTGHYWCVDEDGNYIPDSLVTRTSRPPQCQTSCQRSQLNALIASWIPQSFQSNSSSVPESLIPDCTETGQYTPLPTSETDFDCMLPMNKDAMAQGMNGRNNCPVCPFPFSSKNIKHGAVFCEEVTEGGLKFQKCQVKCRKGYHNVIPSETFLCDLNSRVWVSQPPHPQSCQRVGSFQTVQTEVSFELLLPSSKTCMADYSGLLQAFRTFILDDLKARGLCHIQVNYFGNRGLGTVPVCDDSTVHVECLSTDRLGVNVTWRAQLENIQVPSLPSLHDIEKAIVGENLIGRFLSIIKTGNYTLNLDSKLFIADTTAFFPRDEDFGVSPQVYLGCKDGFQKISNSDEGARNLGGCVICPPGTSAQEGPCRPCPKGSYQENAGSPACMKCPLGTTTAYSGAYKKSQCETSCQMNTVGLLCDDKGRYLPSQKDETMKKYYCVDVSGEKLAWTEVDSKLTNDQCLALRRFQLVSEDKIILLTDEDSVKIKSKRIDGQKEKYLDCFMDCVMEESCDYLSVSTNGSQTVCQQYSGDEPNIVCTTTKQMQGVLGNAASASMEGLTCRFKIKPTSTNSLTVYRKKGHESPEIGLGMYEKTEFGNTVSGVYNTSVFSAEDTSLTDALSFCRQTCRRDPCCNGFILSQVILNRGTILCGLLSSPDVLLCHVNDWSETSTLGGDGVCKGVRSNKEKKTFSFYLGGQEFTGSYSLLSKSLGKVEYSTELTTEVKEEIQRVFITFQRVFLLRDPDKKTLAGDSGCRPIDGLVQASPIVSDSVMELFVPVESDTVTVDKEASLAKQQYWISKQRYSSKQATQWCLTRCKEEESWCRLADLQDSTKEYFTCIIYPETRKCRNTNDPVPDRCDIALNSNPQLLHSRKEILGNKVKHFYTNLPYRKLTEISVRNKISMTGKSVSNGFFECELQCDADPCCKGFGYLQQSRLTGSELLCLTLGSLGIQSCSGTDSSSWRVTDCSTLNEGMESHPFGWFQKPEDRQSFTSALCPATDVSIKEKEGLLDDWQLLDASSVSIDSSLTDYDSVQISGDSPKTIEIAQNYCLSVCSRAQSCVTATVEVLQTKVRCLFYPETQSCYHNLNKHQCSVLVKEPATYIFRKKVSTRSSVTISSGASLFGKSQAIQIGSDIKYVNQFLGIPYAAPPVGDNRFRPPQPYNWTGTWNATTTRSSCLQPGDGKAQYGSVSEDCLYLNVFVPYNTGTGKATLLYFHNSPSDYSENGQTFVDGSYMAAVGDIIVVTASYRVGVFGFLSTGNTTPSGNWGLFDQAAALKWVHENIGHFRGDAGVVSIAADRAGADIASIHLLLADTTAFKRALLMGGSAFSPMLVISERSAQDQVRFLANEVGCLASNNEDVVSCLRKMAADTLNAAQTKLLAQRGPFQTWGPVVDGIYIRDKPSTLIEKEIQRNIDLFIGSAEQDGLIVRAKAIKRFEESQGRGDSKMAFYQALQNSLGGEERNLRVQDAAVWFYSLQHSTDDYSGFSRALENSTRDHFIACPAIKMADYWSEHSKGRVFMYYVPESFSQSSSGLDLPEDVIYAFGLPFHSNYKNQFSIEEQNISLKIMRYVTNFVKTGNPNFQYPFTRKLMRDLPVWPQYLGSNSGDNYKKFSVSLSNSQGLKKAECSFWNDYIPLLKSTTGSQSEILPTKNSIGGIFKTVTSPSGPKPEKEAYN